MRLPSGHNYREAGILPLVEIWKLAAAKHIIKDSSVANHTHTEVEVTSDIRFPKRADKKCSLLSLASDTSELFEKMQMNPRKVSKQMSYSPTPAWEMMKTNFDINYTGIKKGENLHILLCLVKYDIADNISQTDQY